VFPILCCKNDVVDQLGVGAHGFRFLNES
jgi:hypothetical protein